MFRDDFVPQGGFEEWSESIWWRRALQLVSWEKYVRHYAHNGVYKSRGFFGGHITCEELTRMLPTYDRAVLYDRINARVDKMVSDGLFDEVKGLLDSGLSPESTSMQAIGYKEPAAYFRGEMSRDEAIELIKLSSRRYAKRQLTWLRRDTTVLWHERQSF